MRIELKSGCLRLARGETLRVVHGAGTVICAREGTVWITEENRRQDVLLPPGACYRLRAPGVAIVEAFGESSTLSMDSCSTYFGCGTTRR